MKSFLSLLLLFVPSVSLAVCPVAPVNNYNSKAIALRDAAAAKLTGELACKEGDPGNDASPCNVFVSRGLKALYGLDDFANGGGFLSANAIADFVTRPANGWKAIGILNDGDNALCAATLANGGTPVIAVMKKAGHGHVALVLPGEPVPSGSWDSIAPNSAAFSYASPTSPGTYVNEKLSYAFGEADASVAKYYYRDSRPR